MAKETLAGDTTVNGEMTLYTNLNNSSTLKVLIAAKFGGKQVELKLASLSDCIVPGPRQLPLLVVSGELSFFSSNAATAYLFPVIDLSQNGLCQQWQEWEATRLLPAVQRSARDRASAELQASLTALLQHLEDALASGYLIASKISAADVSIWSTLYHVYNNEKLNTTYLAHRKNIRRWFDTIAAESAVQEALKQWGGDGSAPADTSLLGTPCAPTIVSPTVEERGSAVTSEELSAAEEAWLNAKLPPPVEPARVVLPVKDRRNILITSALPYVNNVPHLGNIIGCVLSADIFARYCRCMGYNTLYVCGTDEYGTATETKALEEKVTPRQICDKYFEIHNDVYRWFNIGFDYFGRTSTPEQTEITQRLFLKLKDHGFISSQSVDQLLCKRCNRFLADRFVEGTCPHPGCGYESARGDQCDKCGKLVNATELIDARCKVCGDSPANTKSTQFFLELPQLEPSLRSWFSKREADWSGSARAVARAWFRDGLRARCITRDLKWGVPVPVDGFRDKVFYVWFDACIGYMSITKRYTGEYEKWWKPEPGTDVKLYQFMAKDNVPFHSIIFPATIMGVNEGHTLVSHIFATEYLNYEEGKFSKSRGVGVFGTDAQDTGIPADVWRFYLASVRPEGQDSSFSWTELGTRNNSELLNNLGNFCHRSLSFCASSLRGVVPAVRPRGAHLELIALVNREIAAYVHNMERGKLREALRHVLSVSRLGNQHMQSEQPWVLLKGTPDDRERGETAIALCCNLVALVCTMLAPYMPETCARLAGQLNLERQALRLNFDKPCLHQYLPEGHTLGKSEPLFSKLEANRLEELRVKYAGTQTQRAERENGETTSASTCDLSVSQLEAEIVKQGEKVRQLKSQTKDKAVLTPEVNRLLELKKQLTVAQANSKGQASAPAETNVNVGELEKAIAEQGEKVRQLKSQTKDKAVWTPEVYRLLELKKQLASVQDASTTPAQNTNAPTKHKSKTTQNSKTSSTGNSQTSAQQISKTSPAQSSKSATGQVQVLTPLRADLTIEKMEKEIAEQGERVRQLKSQSKDKSAWTPEVNRLLELKRKLAEAQKALRVPAEAVAASPPVSSTSPEIEKVLAALHEQGERVRLLKTQTRDKSAWAPEVNKLLDLKKQLASLRLSDTHK